MAKNDLDKAESDLRLMLKRDSDHLGALSNLSRVLEAKARRDPQNRQGILDEAIEVVGHALEIKPKDVVLLKRQSELAQNAGRFDVALEAVKRLMKLEPENLKYTVSMAKILHKQGKDSEAEKLLTASLAKDDGTIRLQLGRMKLDSGDLQEAKKFFMGVPSCPKPTGELKPRACPSITYYDAQDELGTMAIKSGKLDEAEKIYSSLVDMNPHDYSAWEVLAALMERRKDWKGAQDAYRKSLAIERKHSSAWLGLGRCLLALGKKDDAVYAFRKAESFLSQDPSQALALADYLLKIGEEDWAKSVLHRAMILSSDDARLKKLIDEKIKSLSTVKPDRGTSKTKSTR